MYHMNRKYPQTSHLCISLQTELTGGINQMHANIISGQAEIGWGEREKLNIEAYLFLHNFVSFLLAVRD